MSHDTAFWAEQAEHYITWFKKWDTVYSGDFHQGDVTWFKGAKLNACYNCLDRHLPEQKDKVALIWEGDEPCQSKLLTYKELHQHVCRFANALKNQGVSKGDRVCIYMPMIIEAVVAMLACARIGAVHSVVFGGFSPQALKSRILDVQCEIVITADHSIRGGKKIPLKENADTAIEDCPCIKHLIVVKYSGDPISWNKKNDLWYHDITKNMSDECPIEEMDAEDPLFILYTSGSTGKPKGVLHTTGGYLLYTSMTFNIIFDYHNNDPISALPTSMSLNRRHRSAQSSRLSRKTTAQAMAGDLLSIL